VRGPVEDIVTDPEYLDVALEPEPPGATRSRGRNAFAYLFQGEARFGGEAAIPPHAAISRCSDPATPSPSAPAKRDPAFCSFPETPPRTRRLARADCDEHRGRIIYGVCRISGRHLHQGSSLKPPLRPLADPRYREDLSSTNQGAPALLGPCPTGSARRGTPTAPAQTGHALHQGEICGGKIPA